MKKYKKKYVHDPNYSKNTVLVVVPVVVGAKKVGVAIAPRGTTFKFFWRNPVGVVFHSLPV
jgi:hypothetical protein